MSHGFRPHRHHCPHGPIACAPGGNDVDWDVAAGFSVGPDGLGVDQRRHRDFSFAIFRAAGSATRQTERDAMSMPKETYIQLAVREFRRTKSLAHGAITQITPEQFFASPAEGDNSVAVIVKHVGGNLLSRWTDFLTADGEKPGRNRDVEFEITKNDTQQSLMQQW